MTTTVIQMRSLPPNSGSGSSNFWSAPGAQYVYIGRRGHGHSGYFGNPIAKGETCFVCGDVHATGGSTLPCYEVYLRERCSEDPEFKRLILALEGKTLVCFCKPRPCHGDIIIKYIEENGAD